MPWEPVAISENANELMKAFPKEARFLVAESLGPEFAPALRRLDCDAIDVFTLTLHGRADEDVYAAAWKERRILLTQNRDFLDDRRFAPHRGPGVVVLPPVNDGALISALVYALPILRKGRELWEGGTIVVSENGRLSVTCHDHNTGARETTLYKLRIAGPPLIWMGEKPKLPAGSVRSA